MVVSNMGCLDDDDEKLSQMITDYIELGSNVTNSPSCSASSEAVIQIHHNPTYKSLQEILEKNGTNGEAEVLKKITFYMKEMRYKSTGKFIIDKLEKKWIVFRLGLDGYQTHLCQTSWFTPLTTCPSGAGDYEYIDVMIKGKNGNEAVRLIVDIDFRAQFELARPTEAYEKLKNALPAIFVGTEEKLKKLISLLCTAAKQSLRERGLHIPPWRKSSYMHSKWLSKNCKKLSFSELGFLTPGYNQSSSNISMSCICATLKEPWHTTRVKVLNLA